MPPHPPIGVDDDLAPGDASVAIGPANHEIAGWIDMQGGMAGGIDMLEIYVANQRWRQNLPKHLLHEIPHCVSGALDMLVRHHDLANCAGNAILVIEGELGFRIRTQKVRLAAVT